MIYEKVKTIKYSRKFDKFCWYSIIQCLHTRFVDSFWAGPGWNWFYPVAGGYWSVGIVGSDMWNVSWISWYMGLCSPVLCSEISCLWYWCVWMYSCSYGSNIEVLLLCFNRDMGLLMGPYSCLLFRMCCA